MHGLTFIDFLIWTSLCTWMMSSIPLHACICYLFNLTIYRIARNTKIWPNTPLRYGPRHRQWSGDSWRNHRLWWCLIALESNRDRVTEGAREREAEGGCEMRVNQSGMKIRVRWVWRILTFPTVDRVEASLEDIWAFDFDGVGILGG